ncbi:HAMP domain-containing sensor histidine kinase [Bdellovibrionota bacterium FG-2]
MKRPQNSSLKHYLTKQITRWSVVGLSVSLVLAGVAVVYFGMLSSIDHLQSVSKAAVKAFRPALISTNNVKEVELQIKDAFQLKPGESILIRDPDLKPFYTLGKGAKSHQEEPTCSADSQKVCWNLKKNRISTLVPIYYDPRTQEIYGYLEANLEPTLNLKLLSVLFILISAGFMIQSFGLLIKLARITDTVGERLSAWANHIKSDPKMKITVTNLPFSDLKPMQEALEGLRVEIEKFESAAKIGGQLTVIRGIAHDILSPVSQLDRLIATLGLLIKKEQPITPDLMNEINRSLAKISDIAKQVKALKSGSSNMPGETGLPIPPAHCNLSSELATLIHDLERYDGELKGHKIKLNIQTQGPLMAGVSSSDCQRIIENLIRNAAHASRTGSTINVDLAANEGGPFVSVRDEGSGVSDEIREKIFNVDFTTKAGRGTGLGLPTVQYLCDKNGAKIDFSSHVGHGSEFSVLFRPTNPADTGEHL